MLILCQAGQIESTAVHIFNAKASAQYYTRRHNHSQAACHAGSIHQPLQDILYGRPHWPVQALPGASITREAAAHAAMHGNINVPQPYDARTSTDSRLDAKHPMQVMIK